jgi:hypothetical protein
MVEKTGECGQDLKKCNILKCFGKFRVLRTKRDNFKISNFIVTHEKKYNYCKIVHPLHIEMPVVVLVRYVALTFQSNMQKCVCMQIVSSETLNPHCTCPPTSCLYQRTCEHQRYIGKGRGEKVILGEFVARIAKW